MSKYLSIASSATASARFARPGVFQVLTAQAGNATARPFVFGALAAFGAFGLMTAKLPKETLAGSDWYNKYPPSAMKQAGIPDRVTAAHHFENQVGSVGPPKLVLN